MVQGPHSVTPRGFRPFRCDFQPSCIGRIRRGHERRVRSGRMVSRNVTKSN
jgi:hypothetical protein